MYISRKSCYAPVRRDLRTCLAAGAHEKPGHDGMAACPGTASGRRTGRIYSAMRRPTLPVAFAGSSL